MNSERWATLGTLFTVRTAELHNRVSAPSLNLGHFLALSPVSPNDTMRRSGAKTAQVLQCRVVAPYDPSDERWDYSWRCTPIQAPIVALKVTMQTYCLSRESGSVRHMQMVVALGGRTVMRMGPKNAVLPRGCDGVH